MSQNEVLLETSLCKIRDCVCTYLTGRYIGFVLQNGRKIDRSGSKIEYLKILLKTAYPECKDLYFKNSLFKCLCSRAIQIGKKLYRVYSEICFYLFIIIIIENATVD